MEDSKSPAIRAEYQWLFSHTEVKLHKSQCCAGVDKYSLDQCEGNINQ